MRIDIVEDLDKEDAFYLGDLTKKQMDVLDRVLNVPDKALRKYNKRIQETAELRGRKCKDIVLRDAQIKPMLMSLLTKRYFIGDKPGLGKTVESASAYANYVYHCIKRGKKFKKVLVVTEGQHVIGFAREWKQYGINILPLVDGSTKIQRKLDDVDMEEYDGVITNWDGLKTNAFLEYYMNNKEDYNYAVFDETSKLIGNTSMTYKVTDMIVNKYKGGLERVIFLNGSSFEKSVFDFYNQFSVLKPKLIPNKAFLEDNYVVREGMPVDVLRISGSRKHKRQVAMNTGAIVGYKNQEELRERLKYYYIARSKKDFASELPEHTHILHMIDMTPRQAKDLKEYNRVTVLNSPGTVDEKRKMTEANSPKYAEVLRFIDMVIEDRPLLYVFNKKAQLDFKKALNKKGYKVGIMNGDVSSADKNKVETSFNNKELDILILNVEKAINLPTSDRIIFYDILTMPQRTSQIKGRIDRDNYDTPKFYDFFCYKDSPEMNNIVRLAYFREKHGNLFTGQEDYTYRELIDQLVTNYGEDNIQELGDVIEEDEDFFDNEDWEDIVADYLKEDLDI